MTVRFERPVSRAAYRGRDLAFFAFIMAVLTWGLHRFGPLETPYFVVLYLISAAMALIALYLALIGLAMLWNRGAKGGKASIRAIILVLLPLVPVGLALYEYVTLPEIYDVSTDLAAPPEWISSPDADQMFLGPRPTTDVAARKAQAAAYRGVTGRRYEGALDRVFTAARKVALDNGIEITQETGAPDFIDRDPQPGKQPDAAPADDQPDNVPVPLPRPDLTFTDPEDVQSNDAFIQGVHRTLVFGLRQDVVIRLREEAETTLVDMRVAARYGRHDLGAGASFIERYLRALDAELLGIAGD